MHQRTCFVISPIGPDGTEIREAANDFLELLVQPALEKYGFLVTRADRIAHPTAITADIIRLVQESDVCIIDLTYNNPNVFYECGRRHETGKPFIQMIRKGHESGLPFDVAGIRTVPYDTSSPRAVLESIRKLQEFIDALVSSGFQNATSGESLSSIAQGIERIERKVNQLLAVPQSPVATGEDFDVYELAKGPREAFMNALRKGKLDTAFSLLDRLKKAVPVSEYLSAAALLVSMGHARSFERLDGEVSEILKDPVSAPERDEVIQIASQAVHKFFENTGQPSEGLKYLESLYGRVMPLDQLSNKSKAFVANRVGMLAWQMDEYDLCVRFTKLALALSYEPSYMYNLALAYKEAKMEPELQDALRQLAAMPDLDKDHLNLLARYGHQPVS